MDAAEQAVCRAVGKVSAYVCVCEHACWWVYCRLVDCRTYTVHRLVDMYCTWICGHILYMDWWTYTVHGLAGMYCTWIGGHV